MEEQDVGTMGGRDQGSGNGDRGSRDQDGCERKGDVESDGGRRCASLGITETSFWKAESGTRQSNERDACRRLGTGSDRGRVANWARIVYRLDSSTMAHNQAVNRSGRQRGF